MEAVGLRLRSLREFHGVSQRELAKRAGVANSAISVIEQGSVSPSVSSLERVLNGFPISVANFFAIPVADKSLQITRVHGDSDRSLFAKLVSCNDISSPDCQVHHYLAAHEGCSKNHFNSFHSLILVTKGSLTFFSTNAEQILNEGDSVSVSPFVPHRVEPLSDESSWIIITV